MTTRREFLRNTSIAGLAGLATPSAYLNAFDPFPDRRPLPSQRKFRSEAVEAAIREVQASGVNPELAWLFSNCFPNTLDTTVNFEMPNGKPDTYVITGDIDAMWLRDSSAQVWPYLPLAARDAKLKQLLAGVIRRQVICILRDPYANAFYKDGGKVSEWKDDLTDMKPGVHERKWEVDSLCYPIRIAHRYWTVTRDTAPFDADWVQAVRLTVQTFREQQRKNGPGPYHFQRTTSWATDGVPLAGYGYPVKPVGLICSMFRASDDATIFPFHIPDNFFAVLSLRQAAELLRAANAGEPLAKDCESLAAEVEAALRLYATVEHPQFGRVYAYEVNGFGSHNLMDDANAPSLLSMPYFGTVPADDPTYQRTRKLLLSTENPFFFEGKAGGGIGSPHTGVGQIWPIGLIMRALTSRDDAEIRAVVRTLVATHAGTGFMHESFDKDDPSKFTRKWFAWANTIFGELVWELHQRKFAF